MKRFGVFVSARALKDMEAIYDYIASELQSPKAAAEQYDRIAKAIKSLRFFPERVRFMASEPENALGYRQLNIDNYAVFFIIEEARVLVIGVLYGASDLASKLAEAKE